MLTLSRKAGEGIAVGTDVEVVVLGISRGRVRLGIRAPRSLAVHRSEVVARIEEVNKAAVVSGLPPQVVENSAVLFEQGLFGLGPHCKFVVCEVEQSAAFRALVSCLDSSVYLLVVEATDVWPNYPVDEAKAAAGLSDDEVVVAAVATVPADDSTPTVNLMAPLVVGLQSRRGVQVILDREDLGVAHPMVVQSNEAQQISRSTDQHVAREAAEGL